MGSAIAVERGEFQTLLPLPSLRLAADIEDGLGWNLARRGNYAMLDVTLSTDDDEVASGVGEWQRLLATTKLVCSIVGTYLGRLADRGGGAVIICH